MNAEPRLTAFRGWQGPVALLCSAAAACAFYGAGERTAQGDELDVIRPALEYMSGKLSTNVKYPSFPFYFYGLFLSLGGGDADAARALVIARAVHAGIGGANLCLAYVLGVELFASRSWGLLTALTYLALPLVLFSASLVKTESLQLTELLLTLVALRRSLREPEAPRWHVLAGAAAAFAIGTKLNFQPALLYGLHLLYQRRRGLPASWRSVASFGAALVGCTLLGFTNLWVFDEIVKGWWRDQYFQPNASLFRAVDELWAFPNGRYSSFLVNTLPLAVGWPLLLGAAGSLWRDRGRGWLHAVLGLGTLLYLLGMLSATMLRIAHAFTPFYPYFALASVSLAHGLASAAPAARGRALAAGLFAAVLGYTGWLASGLPAMRRVERQRDALMQYYAASPGFLTLMESERADRDQEPVRARVERIRPEYLLVTSSHFLNMCKYRNSALYADNCRYYRELIAGRAGYRPMRVLPANIPGAPLQLDPEVREMAYHLLARKAR